MTSVKRTGWLFILALSAAPLPAVAAPPPAEVEKRIDALLRK